MSGVGGGRAAAFLDRDGTIIRDAAYVRDPADVELLPGAAGAIRRLNERGVPVVVITNQSGIARGWVTVQDYDAVRARIEALLADQGATIDASYMCPHHPDVDGPCECRKPGLALYRQAIAEHDLDAAASVFVGDRWRDVAPAAVLGGTPILLDAASTPAGDRDRAHDEGIRTVPSLATAVDEFLDALPASPVRQ